MNNFLETTEKDKPIKLSIVVPCFNEENTLRRCIERVLEITDDSLQLEIILVDDCSIDKSLEITCKLDSEHPTGKTHKIF